MQETNQMLHTSCRAQGQSKSTVGRAKWSKNQKPLERAQCFS